MLAMPEFLPRYITPKFEQALKSAPVVFLTGARQVGKSTLVKQLIKSPDSTYITFDDPNQLLAARNDPSGFLSAFKSYKTVVFDEVQRVPELYLPLKLNVDNERRAGRFVLTGSTAAMFLPKLADALVGRMQILNLHTLSMGELIGQQEHFIDWCFSEQELPALLESGPQTKSDLQKQISKGGFPTVATADGAYDCESWFDSYIQTIISRDVRDIVDVDRLLEFPSLLKLLASRTGSLQNMSEISRTTRIPLNSLKRYLAILEAVCLYQPLSPWYSNLGKRMVKAPKSFLTDTGLVCHLLGGNLESIESKYWGLVLETFALCELRKQLGWSAIKGEIFHWRTHESEEIDFVIESRNGLIAGIEVKASSTVKASDLKWLRSLKDQLKGKFQRGVVLYQGEAMVPFGEGIFALPISALWRVKL